MSVIQEGDCYARKWNVEFSTIGGDQPMLHLHDKDIKGLEARAYAEKVQDGGLVLRPIPGDMLRTAEQQPFVRTHP